MQENRFEKSVRMQMEDFTLVPNGEVWKGLEAKIRKERGRRLLFFWLFAGLLLFGSAGSFFFLNSKKVLPLTNAPVDKKTVGKASPIKRLKNVNNMVITQKGLSQNNAKLKKEIVQHSTQTIENKRPANERRSPSIATQRLAATADKVKQLDALKQVDSESKNVNMYESVDNKNLVSALPERKMEGRTELPPHKYLLSEIRKQQRIDTTRKLTISAKDKTEMRDTSRILGNKAPKPSNQTELRKLVFGFGLQGGLSNNISGLGIGQKSLLAVDARNSASFPSTTPPSSLSGLPTASRLQYKREGSWAVGVYLQKALAKRSALSAGVNYHFMSASSKVGNRVDSTLNVFDTVLLKSNNASSFYRSGQTTAYANTYHLIQIPITLQFQLNKNIQHPLQFSFGLSPSFLIGSNALYLNRNTNSYYREQDQFSRFLLFGQSGVVYVFKNSAAFQMSLGPTLQYSFNSFSKPAINTPQHLLFTGIKANIILK
jgi:hypothetical protein